MNCAACHTSQINYHNEAIRIDGGPGMIDFQSFVRAMDQSLFTLARDEQKFQRFAFRRLGQAAVMSEKVQELRSEIQQQVEARKVWGARNSSSMQYGHGRTDAFGVIINQVVAGALNIESNAREPNSPVSYPVIWDGASQDIVQWIGVLRNNLEPAGPTARNTGQVLGVFGHLDVQNETKGLKGYCSSARREKLDVLENQVRTLWSPQWPERVFGKLDPVKVKAGKAIYDNKCMHCHEVINSREQGRVIHVNMVPISTVKTDARLGKSVADRTAQTGAFAGEKIDLLKGRVMESVEPASTVLHHAVAGAMAGTISPLTCSGNIDSTNQTILNGWKNVLEGGVGALFAPKERDPNVDLAGRMKEGEDLLMRYKARPLNGVWASAPYLHNGSVKNIYEMLLPAAQRTKHFKVGCRNFDSKNVGVDCENNQKTDDANTTISDFDATLDGNLNTGHDSYAGTLTDGDRWALVEYLKSL